MALDEKSFYLILKALWPFLRYLIFCPGFFCHAGKRPKKAKVNFTIYEVIRLETNKGNQKMEFGRLYNMT